ncbi:MAG: Helix-turn-helix domain [Bacteroidetes bacterium]|jgi:transcriptional regulator with XRE-family HTH domain|nr:Helix-turn-helix domain [Bacteroidota bacterium]
MAVTQRDKKLALELQSLRKKHRITQKVLFNRLGLSTQQSYSDLENGKKHFTDDIILNICSTFKISVLQFINQFESPNIGFLMSEDDFSIIEACDLETKFTLYKKLFLESKMEIIENKLHQFNVKFNFDPKSVIPVKHKIYVMV